MAAGFGDALDQTRLGRRGRLVRGQRLVMPLQGHVGVAADPALELREVLPAERTFQVGIERQRETALGVRSEEHTSELQSLMRISYAVFCLKKKKTKYYYQETQKYLNNKTTT